MPRMIPDHEEQVQAAGGFGYSAASIDHLEQTGTTDYSLATICVDLSLSVKPFVKQIELALEASVASLKNHPRSDYMLVRVLTFNDRVTELHGFRLLADCEPSKDYIGVLYAGGMTACYDAVVNAVDATMDYAERLVERFFAANAITIMIGDGMNNRGTHTAADVADRLQAAMKSEKLESHNGILIGVNVNDPEVKAWLAKFEIEAGFDQYIEVENATPEAIAKVGNFIYRSVSATSQKLGSGGRSEPLKF